MFNLFRRFRAHAAVAAQPEKPGAPPASVDGQTLDISLALPEVVEGNADSDWDMWENAVATQPKPSQFETTWPGQSPIRSP